MPRQLSNVLDCDTIPGFFCRSFGKSAKRRWEETCRKTKEAQKGREREREDSEGTGGRVSAIGRVDGKG